MNVDRKTGKIMSVSDRQAIKQSVNMILQTQMHERKIFGDYGSNLKYFMFEVVDPNYISSFKQSVEHSISYCEPHVNEIDVNVRVSSGAVSKIIADIEYSTDVSSESEKIHKIVDVNDENG